MIGVDPHGLEHGRRRHLFSDANDQPGLALQRRTAPLVNRRDQLPPVVLLLGRVPAMKGDDQRQPQGPSDRQGECPAAAEMGVDQQRSQPGQVRLGRQAAKLFEQQPIKRTGEAATPEQPRLGVEIGEPNVNPATDPDRRQTTKAEILPAQEMGLRAGNDPIPIDQQRSGVSRPQALAPRTKWCLHLRRPTAVQRALRQRPPPHLRRSSLASTGCAKARPGSQAGTARLTDQSPE